MPTATVEFYDVIRWIHITAVVIGFGPTFAFGVYLSVAQRRDPRSLPAVFAGMEAVNWWFVTTGGVLIFATGIYLTIDGPWDFGDAFVSIGMLAVIVLLGALHAFFIPKDRKAAEIAKHDIEAATGDEVKFSAEFDRLTRRSAQGGMLAGLIVVVVIYFMTAKPFV